MWIFYVKLGEMQYNDIIFLIDKKFEKSAVE